MTTFAPPFAPPLLGRSSFDQISDSADQEWRQQYYSHTQTLASQWPNTQQLSGIQPLDVRMYPDDHYNPLPHHYDYLSDMDAGTPDTTEGFGDEAADFVSAFPNTSSHLQLPEKPRFRAGPLHSPHSSQGGLSPIPSPIPTSVDIRTVSALPTPPERERRSTGSSTSSGSKGRSTSEDADYFPSEETTKRGRKRQRIPHTAVERRYRENLNAHLDKLRQTVPTLASKHALGAKGTDRGESGKPSKCEILSGAIDHIGTIDRENVALKNEVRALRAKITDLNAWYTAHAR